MSSSYIYLLLIIVILPNSLLLGGTLRKEETLISNWSATLEGLSYLLRSTGILGRIDKN
ncbi:uncharacterized protein RSE6_13759 [Rhynchosporium secalis]|uniref:Uncharacterized protein n=1 Tax=Rhynchosporium secalis TaxID=38038 RepID=A0A1E1MTM0_RHYSE|nr:uncharacterized protein RSE6_13759 [Rhynchosporium secalis]